MKKTLLIATILFASFSARADQKQVLTKKEADTAQAFLHKNNISRIVSWCGCCDNDKPFIILIEKAFTRLSNDGENYELIINGKNEMTGGKVSGSFDLAYLWVKSGPKAHNFATQIGLKNVDPCSLPFDWPSASADAYTGTSSSKETHTTGGTVFKYVKDMPEFPGSVNEFLGNNLRYPESARESGTEGRAVVQFIVGATGDISSIQIVKSSGHEALDNEAMRIVRIMPRWKPGNHNGNPVNVYFTLPITFRLN